MKLTKKAKRCIVYHIEKKVIEITDEYTCPTCNTQHKYYNIDTHITRFKCHYCGQELMVEHKEINNTAEKGFTVGTPQTRNPERHRPKGANC